MSKHTEREREQLLLAEAELKRLFALHNVPFVEDLHFEGDGESGETAIYPSEGDASTLSDGRGLWATLCSWGKR